ncbi:MAG: hypothetical protein ABWZ98_06990 [Nakamurella sp.]
MQMVGVLEAAEADSAAARAALQSMIDTEFLPMTEIELLSLARSFEGVARLAFAAQVRIAGIIDKRKIADEFGATSSKNLLGTLPPAPCE